MRLGLGLQLKIRTHIESVPIGSSTFYTIDLRKFVTVDDMDFNVKENYVPSGYLTFSLVDNKIFITADGNDFNTKE